MVLIQSTDYRLRVAPYQPDTVLGEIEAAISSRHQDDDTLISDALHRTRAVREQNPSALKGRVETAWMKAGLKILGTLFAEDCLDCRSVPKYAKRIRFRNCALTPVSVVSLFTSPAKTCNGTLRSARLPQRCCRYRYPSLTLDLVFASRKMTLTSSAALMTSTSLMGCRHFQGQFSPRSRRMARFA